MYVHTFTYFYSNIKNKLESLVAKSEMARCFTFIFLLGHCVEHTEFQTPRIWGLIPHCCVPKAFGIMLSSIFTFSLVAFSFKASQNITQLTLVSMAVLVVDVAFDHSIKIEREKQNQTRILHTKRLQRLVTFNVYTIIYDDFKDIHGKRRHDELLMKPEK